MQEVELVCTLDSRECKDYELLINEHPSGVISWQGEINASKGCWYTIASDGKPYFFQTQEEAVKLLTNNL